MTNVPASQSVWESCNFYANGSPIEKKTYARTLRNCCSSRIPIETCTRERRIDLDDRMETRLRKTKRIHTDREKPSDPRVPSANVGSPARFDSTRLSLAFALFAALNILPEIFSVCRRIFSRSMGPLVGLNSTALEIKRKLFAGDNPLRKAELALICLPFRIASL